MLIPFRKLFNQATKAGSSDHLILLPGTKLHSKVGSRHGSKLFLEAGSANRYDAEFPARFSFAPIAFLAAVRWAVFGPRSLLACFRARSRNRLVNALGQAKHPFFHMRVISVRSFSLSLMPLKIELYHWRSSTRIDTSIRLLPGPAMGNS